MASSKTSRHDVSWSSLTFGHFPSVNWTHREKFHSCPSMIVLSLTTSLDSLHAITNLVVYCLDMIFLVKVYTDTCVSSPFSLPLVCLIFSSEVTRLSGNNCVLM